ncbi:MAG: peptidase U32 family protein [Culicoidibacterales bacterium]
MQLLVNPCSHEHLLSLLTQDIDGIIIGETSTALRLNYTYDLIELADVITIINQHHKAIYIDMHTMIDNKLIPPATALLTMLASKTITGVIYADPAIYQIAHEINFPHPLVWSSETTATNWYSVEYWANKGVHHVALAKELTKTAIKSINDNLENRDVLLEIQAFGPLSMFHSRRNLLNNYYQHLDLVNLDSKIKHLFDKDRNNYYPIFENVNGTHIMSPKDICLIDELPFLASCNRIKYLKLDSLGHGPIFMDTIISLFIEARQLFNDDIIRYEEHKSSYLKQIAALYDENYRTIDKGFLYKPTIY